MPAMYGARVYERTPQPNQLQKEKVPGPDKIFRPRETKNCLLVEKHRPDTDLLELILFTIFNNFNFVIHSKYCRMMKERKKKISFIFSVQYIRTIVHTYY